MSDPTPNPDPGPEQPPDPDAGPAPADQVSDADGARYAVYDTRYLRFVGAVSAKRPTKAQARDMAGHDDVEVRKV
jgi:hypothetical protein